MIILYSVKMKINFFTIWIISVINFIMKTANCGDILRMLSEEKIFQSNQSTITEFSNTTASSITVKSLSSLYWMLRAGIINNDLINIQAIIVKDEDADMVCNKGERKSERRHLMCAGSILNENHVLTSASCLHEALHIRENIRGALAVAIVPWKSTVQIIKVAEYRIHPKHNTNPYSSSYVKHNVAILSLACDIEPENYHRIELPNRPMINFCNNRNCIVAIYKIVGYSSHVVSQNIAPNLGGLGRINYKYRAKRFSDGSHSCAQTGTAVMRTNTQVAIVAVSCDDRKPNTEWLYTDLYTNKHWINNILENWNSANSDDDLEINSTNLITTSNSSFASMAKSCENCIFNFYISIGCKGKENCERPSVSSINARTKNLQEQHKLTPGKSKNQKSCSTNSSNCSSSDIVENTNNKTTKGNFQFIQLRKNRKFLDLESHKKEMNLMEKNVHRRIPNWQRQENDINGEINNYRRQFRKRIKRGMNFGFITREFNDNDDDDDDDDDNNIMKMQALIVKDEDAGSCCAVAKQIRHHIDAALAIMIGATTGDPYVIKINRFEMHPNYVVDVNAKDHSVHNLAILFLACSIKAKGANIPKLPKGKHDDIGHMCCSQKCSVVTIIQSYNNTHVAKKLTAKYIPSPQHEDEDNAIKGSSPSSLQQKKIFKIPNIHSSTREKRSREKLTGAPILFPEESLPLDEMKKYKSKNSSKRGRKMNHQIEILSQNRYNNTSIIGKILTGQIFRRANGRKFTSNMSMIDQAITAFDWNNIEKTMEEKISMKNKFVINQFIKDVVQETMKTIMKVFSKNGQLLSENINFSYEATADKNAFFTFLPDPPGNRSIDHFSSTLMRIIQNLMPPNDGKEWAVSSDLSLDERDVGKPPLKYVECPPLGTPVIINGTLIAMVAYTCDDIQNWVKWKYVSISNNIIWLRKRLDASLHQSLTICDDASYNEDLQHNKSGAEVTSADIKP
ncbi:uncharacterized protein [Fopius arisanus]|uniref:Uncharacterized protein isoform X2 n=1 Tax=Fopius arisanus TaxID=64838 RepID=A0A9R1TP31_9HYME|nr:PREDICTED: uncharacterized protein LOC105272080 isoform X2 [Fopius arisanus]